MKGNMEHSEVRARTDWVVRGMAGEGRRYLQSSSSRQSATTTTSDTTDRFSTHSAASMRGEWGHFYRGRAGINYEAKSGGLAGTFSLTLSSL